MDSASASHPYYADITLPKKRRVLERIRDQRQRCEPSPFPKFYNRLQLRHSSTQFPRKEHALCQRLPVDP